MAPQDFSVKRFINDFCPGCVKEIHSGISEELGRWEKRLDSIDTEIDAYFKTNTPENVRVVALSVFRTLYETAMCVSVFSCSYVLGCVLWTGRVISINMPFIISLLTGSFDSKSLSDAWHAVKENAYETFRRFKPAIGVTALVAGVVYLTFGWLTMSYLRLVKSSFYLLSALIAFDAVLRDPITKVEVPAVTSEPGSASSPEAAAIAS